MMQQVDEMMLHMDDSDSSDEDNKNDSNEKNNNANTLLQRQPREVGGIKSKNWCCWILGMFWRLLARSSGGCGTMRMMAIITILIVQVALKIYYCRGGSGKQGR
eukprot:scaffold3044_cov161-Skeletonema_menzelii.AAC.2